MSLKWEKDRNSGMGQGQEFGDVNGTKEGILGCGRAGIQGWEKGKNLRMGTCPCGGKKARILAWEYVPEVGKRAGIWRYFRAGIQ